MGFIAHCDRLPSGEGIIYNYTVFILCCARQGMAVMLFSFTLIQELIMSIITISRGSYSRGKEVAEKLASRLGYECISRDILLEASDEFNIPEIKLVRALHDAPQVMERFHLGKKRFISFIRSSLLQRVKSDNIVYHGLAGHYFLGKVPGVLKVRINADINDRVKEEMVRENISSDKALYILQKDDEEQQKMGFFSSMAWTPGTADSMTWS